MAETDQIALKLFGAGSDAVTKGNFAYAVDSFTKCCKLAPEKLIYRQALRGAERKMYGDNRKGGMMAGLKMKPAMMKLKAAKARKKWTEVAEHAEDALHHNPWDPDALYELGYACKELEWTDVGIWVMETARDAARDRADVFRLLADLYEQGHEFDKAGKALAMVQKLDPSDHDAASRARQMAASSTIQRIGDVDEAAPATPGTAATPAVPAKPQTYEERVRSEIEALQARLADEPANVSLHLDLAESHRKLGDYTAAAKSYQQALDAAGGGDPDIRARLLDCQIQPLRQNLEVIKDRLEKADPAAPDAAERAQKLRVKQRAFEAEIVKREVELYRFRIQFKPDDFEAQYELGYRLLRLGQVDDAIKALQQGRKHHGKQVDAYFYLGKAFMQKKNPALAESNLAAALDACPESDEDRRKNILYHRARVAEERKDTESALKFYNEIATLDYGYRDVAQRIDAINVG